MPTSNLEGRTVHRKMIAIATVLLAVAAGCSSSPSGKSERSTSDGQRTSRACSVAEPADLTAAGIEGKITLTPDFADFTISGEGTDPTTCVFNVDGTTPRLTNVVLMTDNGGAEQYEDIVSNELDRADNYVKTPIKGLGDQAILAKEKSLPDEVDSERSTRRVLARKGKSVLEISVLGDTIPTENLEKLARIIVPKLP